MGRSSPQSADKRQRERRKQLKRAEKLERRLLRHEEKKRTKAEGEEPGVDDAPVGEAQGSEREEPRTSAPRGEAGGESPTSPEASSEARPEA